MHAGPTSIGRPVHEEHNSKAVSYMIRHRCPDRSRQESCTGETSAQTHMHSDRDLHTLAKRTGHGYLPRLIRNHATVCISSPSTLEPAQPLQHIFTHTSLPLLKQACIAPPLARLPLQALASSPPGCQNLPLSLCIAAAAGEQFRAYATQSILCVPCTPRALRHRAALPFYVLMKTGGASTRTDHGGIHICLKPSL